ncbi:MAG: GH25 family lysozyme [Acutalibacteraceae bacterium]
MDVSGWQPANITRTIPADFAIVKATEGVDFTNASWVSQITGAIETGKIHGLYHYANGGNAIAEADYFVNTVGSYVGRSMLVLDWESYRNASWGNGNWVRDWVNRVHDRTSVWPVVYVQASAVWQIPQDVRQHCMLWKAQYASNAVTGYQSQPWNAGSAGEGMLQYTSHGVLNGYGGFLDLDLFFGDKTAWGRIACGERSGCVPNSFANTGTTTTVKHDTPNTTPNGDVNQMANDVIAGKYGNGATRRALLGGYYDSVMRIVNNRLGCGTVQSSAQCVYVQSGDTLSSIASRYGGSWNEWTGYRSGNPNIIYAGERVCRSGVSTGGARRYTVRAGDTLSGIAARYRINTSQIKGYRSGNPNVIYPGETLYW